MMAKEAEGGAEREQNESSYQGNVGLPIKFGVNINSRTTVHPSDESSI